MENMAIKLSLSAILLLWLFAQNVKSNAVFDVTKYGERKSGANPDVTQGFLRAWKEACASTTPSKVVIPPGTFTLTEVKIQGKCKAPVEINLQGTLKAPIHPGDFKSDGWITINYVDHLTISGGGTFDGQGPTSWAQNDCHKNTKCKFPASVRFNFITNSIVRDVTSLDSKNFHINVLGCKNFTFQHFTISAPEHSINTDGIHIGRSDDIFILDTTIKTGDDCISLGDGSRRITAERVTCGPGHGISVGSLGKYTGEEPVNGFFVKNCTITGTDNGVRIKTWPASKPGAVSDIHFEDIIMNNVENPIVVDQEYCPYNLCSLSSPSQVKISNISFKNIRGTSATKVAVKLVCSKSFPCQNVEIGDIDLTYTGPEGPIATQCSNVHPKFTGKQNPPVCLGPARS